MRRRSSMTALAWGAALSCALAAGCSEGLSHDVAGVSAAGTTVISIDKTAEGWHTRSARYDWSLTKTADASRIVLGGDGTGAVTYTLTATRTLAGETDAAGVRGQVCVHNDGNAPTEGLRIVTQVQYFSGGGFVSIDGAVQTQSPAAQIDAWASQCYPYSLSFTPVDGATYRVLVTVTITNYEGHVGTPYPGMEAACVSAEFDLPEATVSTEPTCPEADLSDAISCPAGMTCTPSDAGPWHLTDSRTITYTTRLASTEVLACGLTLELRNTASLSACADSAPSATATVTVATPACTPPPPPTGNQGCTPGYWKNHPGSWVGYSPTQTVGSVFSAASTYGLGDVTLQGALEFMGGPGTTGAARILLRAAVAALLNASNPGVAYPRTSASVIADVNAALASGSRGAMLTLATALDNDNNGAGGCPLH